MNNTTTVETKALLQNLLHTWRVVALSFAPGLVQVWRTLCTRCVVRPGRISYRCFASDDTSWKDVCRETPHDAPNVRGPDWKS